MYNYRYMNLPIIIHIRIFAATASTTCTQTFLNKLHSFSKSLLHLTGVHRGPALTKITTIVSIVTASARCSYQTY